MIIKKTIILICKETSTFPMYFLGRHLEKKNNVHYFFIMGNESLIYSSFTKNTYHFLKKKIKKKYIHDSKDILIKFFKNYKKKNLNKKKIERIEKLYTHFSNLNQQILSSQLLSSSYHDRYYYNNTTYEQNLFWLILNYEKIEVLINKIKPDYIFDIDSEELQRTVLNEISYHKKIPYVTIEHSRYKSYMIPTFTLGYQLDNYFIKKYELNKKNHNLEPYIKELESYKKKKFIMPEMYKNDITSSYNFTFFQMLKSVLNSIKNFMFKKFKYDDSIKNLINHDSPLISIRFKRIKHEILYSLKKYYLYSNFNNIFSIPTNEKYIYYPLHLIPESSVFQKSPMYTNELNLIEAISKSLPITWKLYVKEHQAMIGERSLSFYKRLNKIHNVKLIKTNFYKDPKPIIQKSIAVITITGSGAFEAAMLQKPSIIFGSTSFEMLPSVYRLNSFEELKNIFKIIQEKNTPSINMQINDCAAYLKTLEDVAVNLNTKSLIELSKKKIISKELDVNEKSEFEKQFSNLIEFYLKAVKSYHG